MAKKRAPSEVSTGSSGKVNGSVNDDQSKVGSLSNMDAMMLLTRSLWHDISGSGASVGELDSVPENALEALRTAAEGNSLGMVDESQCLALIAELNRTQCAIAAADESIMSLLGEAFNYDELRLGAEISERRLSEGFFEMRFGIELKGRFENVKGNQSRNVDHGRRNPGETLVQWQHDDILDVWDVLVTLPAQDVSENTAIKAFEAISGNRGFWSPRAGEVQLGQGLNDSSAERLDHTVRHEIGHAVHDSMESMVDSWLDKAIGFRILGRGIAGCRALVESLGGFPADVDEEHVLALLNEYLSRGGWNTQNPIPADDSEWEKMPQAVKDAVDSSADTWYEQYKEHPSGSEGRVFFNHYYENTMAFSAVAEQAIDATGRNYSAMSPGEFFANCYAEYFGDPAGYTDNTKWGGGLPASVKSFFKQNILLRQPYAPPEASEQINPAETTSNTSGIPQ